MGALLARMHQLVDRRRGGGDDAGRQRRGEDIGTADEAQHLELRVVGHAEAADRADRLGEGADDEIDVLLDALLLIDAAAIGRSEEHTSELQSLMRISYAVF